MLSVRGGNGDGFLPIAALVKRCGKGERNKHGKLQSSAIRLAESMIIIISDDSRARD
jgi:hypothetical protein